MREQGNEKGKKAWEGEKHENERLVQQEQMESRDKKKTPQDPLGDPDFVPVQHIQGHRETDNDAAMQHPE